MNGVKPRPTPPFELNHIRLSQTLEENLGYWDQRREIWQGDTFSFDYCLGRVIAQDIEALGGLGLNGMMICQELRCAFPTALLNYVMGLKLWQPKLDIRVLIETCFSGAFGAGWGKALLYLERVSAVCSIDDWLSGYPAADPQKAAAWLGAADAAKENEAFICAQECMHQGAQALSWQYLADHTVYAQRLAELCIIARWGGSPRTVRRSGSWPPGLTGRRRGSSPPWTYTACWNWESSESWIPLAKTNSNPNGPRASARGPFGLLLKLWCLEKWPYPRPRGFSRGWPA